MKPDTIHQIAAEFTRETGIRLSVNPDGCPQVSDAEILPYTTDRDTAAAGMKPGQLDGLEVVKMFRGLWEAREYQAGPRENELWIYYQGPSLRIALRQLRKGNNRPQDAIEIWK